MRWLLLVVSLAMGCGPSVGAATGGAAGTGGTTASGSSEGSDGEAWVEPPMPENCGDAVLADGWLHISADEYDERDKLDGVAVIDGDLVIRRSELTDLDLLRCVREITGTLHIYDNDALVDVSGLWWVERLGGDLIVADNDALVEFDALAKVREIEREELDATSVVDHSVAFIRNASLERIRGLEDLEHIPGDLVIRDNPALVSLEGLVGLAKVAHALAINHNVSLCTAAFLAVWEGLDADGPRRTSAFGNRDSCPQPWPELEPREDCWHVEDCPTGTKCAPTGGEHGGGWDELNCTVVAEAPVDVGDLCHVEEHLYSGIDDCARGAACLAGQDLVGECLASFVFQRSSAACVDPLTVGVTVGQLSVCLERCDPLAPACEGGQKCQLRNRGFGPHEQFICDASGQVQSGESCGSANMCAGGTACVTRDGAPVWVGAGTCQPFCSLVEPECPDTQTCTPWYEADQAPPGLDDVGICL